MKIDIIQVLNGGKGLRLGFLEEEYLEDLLLLSQKKIEGIPMGKTPLIRGFKFGKCEKNTLTNKDNYEILQVSCK